MLPQETIIAAFPPSVACGKAALRPMTLSHVIAMEALRIPFDGLTSDNALIAAYILSKDPSELSAIVSPEDAADATERIPADMAAWMANAHIGKREALNAVAEAMRIAFMTYVPRANGGENRVQLRMRGYGWPLEIAEALMSRCHMPYADAMSMPVCRIFALLAIGNAAQGCGGGPDYYERIEILNIKKARVEAVKRKLDGATAGTAKEDGDGRA